MDRSTTTQLRTPAPIPPPSAHGRKSRCASSLRPFNLSPNPLHEAHASTDGPAGGLPFCPAQPPAYANPLPHHPRSIQLLKPQKPKAQTPTPSPRRLVMGGACLPARPPARLPGSLSPGVGAGASPSCWGRASSCPSWPACWRPPPASAAAAPPPPARASASAAQRPPLPAAASPSRCNETPSTALIQLRPPPPVPASSLSGRRNGMKRMRRSRIGNQCSAHIQTTPQESELLSGRRQQQEKMKKQARRVPSAGPSLSASSSYPEASTSAAPAPAPAPAQRSRPITNTAACPISGLNQLSNRGAQSF